LMNGNTGINTLDARFTLDVSGTFRVSGNASIGGSLLVTGAGGATINASLGVSGNASIGGTLLVTGAGGARINASLGVLGDVSVGGSLRITNNSSIGNNTPYAMWDPSNGNKLITTGEYYGQDQVYGQTLTNTGVSAASPTFTNYLQINKAGLPAGNYKITASFGYTHGNTTTFLLHQIRVKGTLLGGQGAEAPRVATTSIQYITRILYTTLTAGDASVALEFSNSGSNSTVQDVNLEMIRVS
jgi:hypothetical protein